MPLDQNETRANIDEQKTINKSLKSFDDSELPDVVQDEKDLIHSILSSQSDSESSLLKPISERSDWTLWEAFYHPQLYLICFLFFLGTMPGHVALGMYKVHGPGSGELECLLFISGLMLRPSCYQKVKVCHGFSTLLNTLKIALRDFATIVTVARLLLTDCGFSSDFTVCDSANDRTDLRMAR